jgi:hypothetical protein
LGIVSSAPRQNLLNPKEATLPFSWFVLNLYLFSYIKNNFLKTSFISFPLQSAWATQNRNHKKIPHRQIYRLILTHLQNQASSQQKNDFEKQLRIKKDMSELKLNVKTWIW